MTSFDPLAALEITAGDDPVCVRLAGEVDLSNADELGARLLELMRNDATGMVLDLSRLSYLDSSGIRMLLTLVGRLTWRGQQLAIVAPEGSRVRRVLELAGAGEALVVDRTERLALERLTPPSS